VGRETDRGRVLDAQKALRSLDADGERNEIRQLADAARADAAEVQIDVPTADPETSILVSTKDDEEIVVRGRGLEPLRPFGH